MGEVRERVQLFDSRNLVVVQVQHQDSLRRIDTGLELDGGGGGVNKYVTGRRGFEF